MRKVGLGAQVDELELAMNRAAERAAIEAAPVFVRAIQEIRFDDARAILGGGARAATDYFQRRTSQELERRFQPIVRVSMEQVGLVRLYEGLIGRLNAFPMIPKPRMSLDEYVTERSLAGLFTVLAQEEARIRSDPAARTTQLLRTVFGSR